MTPEEREKAWKRLGKLKGKWGRIQRKIYRTDSELEYAGLLIKKTNLEHSIFELEEKLEEDHS